MGQKAVVCESTEPPGSTTLPTLTNQTFSQSVQELLPLFSNETSFRFSPVTHLSRNLPAVLRTSSSPEVLEFKKRYYPLVATTEWNDWKWQMKNRIRSFGHLSEYFDLTPEEHAAEQCGDISFPLSITPYYLSLFATKDACHPLRKAMVPQIFESLRSIVESEDPLGEEEQSPIPGLIHRYPDRVLFLVTTTCSCYCRYCTRSRVVGNQERHEIPLIDRWTRAIAYINEHREVRDVLVSGGDPLMLSDDQLQWILSSLRKIPHVEIIRVGTKTPMVLPQRITPQLVKIVKKVHPLFMSIHATHPEEITQESRDACARLADAGIPLGSQTVLLSGINDNEQVMKQLMQGLLTMRVRPYYLYQCDPIIGSGHFRTPVQKGVDIIESLRGHTTGYAVPTFVIDAPGGGGKIPVMPDYRLSGSPADVVMKNYEGRIFVYHDEKGTTKYGGESDEFQNGGGI